MSVSKKIMENNPKTHFMKKSIETLGKTLNKQQQQSIHGGGTTPCDSDRDCLVGQPPFCQAACLASGICIFNTLTCF
jgi:hypothetical protein